MELALRPVKIPFMIGDTVWVDQSCGDKNQHPYFQAKIIQIILDGSLTNSIVIRQRVDVQEIVISTGIYDLKPSGDRAGLPRVSIMIAFLEPQNSLFKTEQEVVSYQNRLNYVVPISGNQSGSPALTGTS